jgi:hypothetical protein
MDQVLLRLREANGGTGFDGIPKKHDGLGQQSW